MYNNGMGGMASPMMHPGGMPPMGNPMMHPGGVMPPYNPNMGGMTGLDTTMMSVQQILSVITTGIFLKQEFDYMGALTGCERPNRYYVYELNPMGEAKRRRLFKCDERPDWCAKHCMSADCRPFELKIEKVTPDPDMSGGPVLYLQRECKCTCMCLNRPEMKVYLTEGGQKTYLGKVYDPYDCCHHSFEVFDAKDQKRFTIQANCCQLGFCCKCPCDACEKIEFELFSGQENKVEAPILKLGKGCVKNAMGSADDFRCPFPAMATWEDKALLISALMMIDFMMFEEKPDDNVHQSNSYQTNQVHYDY